MVPASGQQQAQATILSVAAAHLVGGGAVPHQPLHHQRMRQQAAEVDPQDLWCDQVDSVMHSSGAGVWPHPRLVVCVSSSCV
jgi:hypothetical protein